MKNSYTLQEVLEPFKGKNVDVSTLTKCVQNICDYIRRKHLKHKGRTDFILEKYENYFSFEEEIQVTKHNAATGTENLKHQTLKKGRPKKQFDKCCTRTKKMRMKQLAQDDSTAFEAVFADKR